MTSVGGLFNISMGRSLGKMSSRGGLVSLTAMTQMVSEITKANSKDVRLSKTQCQLQRSRRRQGTWSLMAGRRVGGELLSVSTKVSRSVLDRRAGITAGCCAAVL